MANGIVQLIPVDTHIEDVAAGTYKAVISGTSQLAFQFLIKDANAEPKVSVWGSNDNVNWDIYELSAGVTEQALAGGEGLVSTSLIRDSFPHEYLSISIDRNGGTQGLIMCKLNVKQQSA